MAGIADATTEDASLRYDVVVDPTQETSHGKLVRYTGRGKRVLDLGCATGGVARALVARGCQVWGVEIDPVAAESAAPFCDRLVVGDLDTLDLGNELKGETFDVVLAGDVLEHLRDPARVLRALVDAVRPGGHLVLSVPNVAHGSVRLALLHGGFPRSDTGLLDDTHIQFFTRDQIVDLVDSNGWTVVFEDATRLAIADSEVAYPDDELTAAVIGSIEADPLALTYQFVLVATPGGPADLDVLPGLVKRLDDTTRELHGGLAEALAVVAGESRRIEALQSSLDELRAEIELRSLSDIDRELHHVRQVDKLDRQLAHIDALRLRAVEALESAELERDAAADALDALVNAPVPEVVLPTPSARQLYLQAGMATLRGGRSRLRRRARRRAERSASADD